jgi:hypothetical protein
MLKRELEILLKDAQLAIKDLEKENLNLKSRNEALTRFVAAVSVSVTSIVEPKKKAIDAIRAALSDQSDNQAMLDRIIAIINAVPEDKA